MLKILLWVVSNNARFFQGAMSTLERQHNGFEVIGFTANEEIRIVVDGEKVPFIPLNKIEWGGGGI